MSAVVFTASRTITKKGLAVMQHSLNLLKEDAPPDHDFEFISGAADGGDTFLSLATFAMFPNARQTICVPDYHHNEILVAFFRLMQRTGRNVEVINTDLPPLERNGFMLDRGGKEATVFAYPSNPKEQMRGSGTWACIRWARKRGMTILYHPLNGEPTWGEWDRG